MVRAAHKSQAWVTNGSYSARKRFHVLQSNTQALTLSMAFAQALKSVLVEPSSQRRYECSKIGQLMNHKWILSEALVWLALA